MSIKESTHYYSQDGKPCYTVIGANGKERNTNLRDARKDNLVPSVTTILGIAAKPGLEVWKLNQAVMSALTLPQNEDESLDDFAARAKSDAREQGVEAAKRGTEIHADIERGFLGEGDSVAYKAVREALDKLFPDEEWIAEDSFSNYGYGGKVDLYSKNGIVVDFKTKDGLAIDSKPEKLVYDEHGMQLSAYAYGLGVSLDRVSVFIDRAVPSIVLTHVWDRDTRARHLEMFLALRDYWFLAKKYQPEGV